MGWLRKLTGVDKQIKAAEKNEKATSAAARDAAQANIKQAQEQALEASRQQQLIAERAVAADAAAAAVSLPLDTAEVRLDAPTDASAAATGRAKRKKFATGVYTTGVGI
jgi:hypothetical protein